MTDSSPALPGFDELHVLYRSMLTDNVLPFWEKNSIDTEGGGYFSCLDRKGRVYDTDKFVWLQARQAWTFAMAFNRLEPRPRWLEIARHGIEFLKAHGRDEEGNWYFALTREGAPLVQPYNLFSDCFAAMAFAQFARAARDDGAAEIAVRTYRNILGRKDNPKGKYNKLVQGTRPLQSFAIPMILLNLTMEMERLLPPEETEEILSTSAGEISERFLDRALGVAREHVAPDGTHVDSFEGRLVNPGHTIEGTWFLMDYARRSLNTKLINVAVRTLLSSLRFGWDDLYGGIFYFLDAEGRPPLQLEWDQKLWWVHIEALVALSMAYELTKNKDCLAWLTRVHDYTWKHFPDPEHGEWFGYLNRRGEVYLPIKGGKWKGCFHVPRGLYLCAEIYQRLAL
ncbi:MAG: AGE family epimerase/isomerase [Bacteroidota bacterium]